MPETMLDLQAWCDPDSTRLCKPFVRNEWRCAVDGKAAVRLHASGEPDTESPIPGTLMPDLQPVFAPAEKLTFAPWPADWETWEMMEIPGERKECPECHGEASVCPDCDGDGGVACEECGQERDCSTCGGTGQVGEPCKTCENRGYIFEPARAFHLAGKVWVAERYLRRVADLPNLHYACQDPPEHKPVFFRFDGSPGGEAGGEAAMMPVVGPSE